MSATRRSRAVGVAEVDAEHVRADAVLGGELSCELAQPLLAASDEDDVVARAGRALRAIASPMPDEAPVTSAVDESDGSGKATGQPSSDRAARARLPGTANSLVRKC